MQCHSMSIKSHQLELSVSLITTSKVGEISKICCLNDVSMCGTFNRPRKTVTEMSRVSCQMILVPIWPLKKICTNNVVTGGILNEKCLKSHTHLPEKLVFIA